MIEIISVLIFISILILMFRNQKNTTEVTKYNHVFIDYDVDTSNLLKLINEYRVTLNLKELIPDKFLTEIAKQHCLYMIKQGKISHDGFSERSNLVLSKGASFVGEVVAAGFINNERILEAYLNSPLHKKEIELPPYNKVGVVKMYNEVNKMYNAIIFAHI